MALYGLRTGKEKCSKFLNIYHIHVFQGCELHVAGFKFAVLNNGFVVHKGYKTADTFHSKKDEENDKNRELFREFKEGLKTRYPESKLQC